MAFVVSKVEAGQSLQVFLSAKLSVSKRAAKNLMDDRAVWVNRKCVWMAHNHAFIRKDHGINVYFWVVDFLFNV